MIKKERYISNTDYELLKKLYPNNMDEIIKKIKEWFYSFDYNYLFVTWNH